jgi:hypothetical protein
LIRGEPGFFDADERLKELSAKGDDLERLFRADLERAGPRSDQSKGGRPPYESGSDVQDPDPPVEPFAVGRACQWRRDFPQKWRRKIPQSGGLAISHGRDRFLRFLSAGRDASGRWNGTAAFGLRTKPLAR